MCPGGRCLLRPDYDQLAEQADVMKTNPLPHVYALVSSSPAVRGSPSLSVAAPVAALSGEKTVSWRIRCQLSAGT